MYQKHTWEAESAGLVIDLVIDWMVEGIWEEEWVNLVREADDDFTHLGDTHTHNLCKCIF